MTKNTITLRVAGKERTVAVPMSWDALPLRDFLAYYQLLFGQEGTSPLSTAAFSSLKTISITQHVLGVNMDFLLAWEALRKKEHGDADGELFFLEELKAVIRHTLGGGESPKTGEGLFSIETDDKGNTSYSVNLNRTINPWPSLQKNGKGRVKARVYYGPSDGLANLTIYELGMAFQVYENYLATNDAALAHHLLAILYRPSRPITQKERDSAWGGDRRMPLRGYEAKVAERQQLMAELPAMVQRALLFWFAGCRQSIVNAYPKVFKSGKKNESGHYGWGGVLLSVAEGGAMGALGEVSDQHHSNVLTYLSMKADEASEAEKTRKKK